MDCRKRCQQFLICSDAVSALTSIKSGTATNHQGLLYDILFIYITAVIEYCIHVGPGSFRNERADKLAKKATKK